MSWNVRGACNYVSRKHIAGINLSVRPALCCLQETKCAKWSGIMIAQLGMGQEVGWIEAPSRGLSGGLLTVWSKELISISNYYSSHHWLLVQGINSISKTPFACLNIYAPQTSKMKQLLWEELKAVISSLPDHHICLLGDFNAVRQCNEKFNCHFNGAVADAFNSFISSVGLLEIPLINSSFTWFGPNQRKGRLDRVLVSPSWYDKGEWVLQALHRKLSDHKPLVLKSNSNDWGPRPFKFFNYWLSDPVLTHNLKASWKGSQESNPQSKFKELREVARTWNKTKLGNVDVRIQQLENMQDVYDVGGSISIDISVLRTELHKLHQWRASMLCQKSKVNWLLNGEKNTRFFHRAMVKRRAANAIKKLTVGDTLLTDAVAIKAAFQCHFQERLTESNGEKVFDLGTTISNKLSQAQSMSLEAAFTLEEVKMALDMTDKTKAPGPDGVNAGLLVLLWDEIKEVMDFFNKFHSTGGLPRGYNSSFIALIPKLANPSLPSDFRPISLMNALVKLLTKVMANRLKPLMDDLVSQHQSAFIKNRQISDGILITSEMVALLRKQQTKGLIFKIDFEKAFDRVKWDFVFDVFAAMNFGSRWITWIKNIFQSSRISVLVNGAPTGEFHPSRGLRQGDPLSPLIFNLVGESLSSLINIGVKKNIFSGIYLKGGIDNFTHLQYADDVILFIRDEDSSVIGVKRILQCFQIISGMKVNFSKSKIYSFHATRDQIQSWTSYLCCIVRSKVS